MYNIVYKLLLFFSVWSSSAFGQALRVKDLQVEHQQNPMTVETAKPRLSWKLDTEIANTVQTSYEIRVGEDKEQLQANKCILWKIRTESDQSILIPYAGPALKPNTRYYWQVRVTDNHHNTSAWSSPQFWQTGIKAEGWQAKWVTVPTPDTIAASPMFRKTYGINKEVKHATAYISARGLYEFFINGQRIGDDFLTPGWTSYHKRMQYQSVDVTEHLQRGNNTLAAILGDGWYKGRIGFTNQRAFYGDTRALLAQVHITYTDGSQQVLGTDGTWSTAYGPILASDIYDGEIYDARKEKENWLFPTYAEDRDWKPVNVVDYGYTNLVGTQSPGVKKQERFPAKEIKRTPKGELVVDFGQNLVGWVEIRANGPSGTKITISHAEVLDKAGNFYTTNLRSAKQQNTYILNGAKDQVFAPHFSFQGFRFIRLEGYSTEPNLADITAVALYSDMQKTGTFETSHPLLNQLQHNITWGQKGNFLDVPTDCPQRDERLGWTGDAQAFFNTAAFNMDVRAFFTKWMQDVKADQLPDGSIPFVVPNVLGPKDAGSAGWADVATIIPWGMYWSYGDTGILRDQYPSMKAWVDFIKSKSPKNLWNTGFHFGDWLFYRPDDDNDGRAAVTDKYLIAQCFYAHSTQLLIQAARVLGYTADEQQYTRLLHDIKNAFQHEYMTATGRLVSSTQTAYVLALQFDMLPENLRQQAAERLVDNIRTYGNHLTTGFLGTPYLCHVLTRFGYTDVAYDLLLQETYPSWLYPVKMGATTIWERWDGTKPDGSFQTPSMNSYNHYAYGAIGDWMYKHMAGIQAAEASYKKIRIAPKPGPGITSTASTLETPYGEVSSSWRVEGGQFSLSVRVPPNTTATIHLPENVEQTVKEISVGSGSHQLKAKISSK
ncbi:family 78 glycoside hydrolase catalytic domain [Sphingobacterium suaedae]|uniref:alpha-L-rhamnosidase n=1 Tax=Sphingobacterium suaedae TaxID=1686402 RepID=A0ABW5KFQ6_9SPHI